MDTVQDSGSTEVNPGGRNDRLPEQGCSSSAVNSSVNNSSAPGSYRLFNRQRPICEIVGGGKAADIMLWKRRQVSLAIILATTIAWILFERAGLSLVSVSSDVLLILVVVLFIRANGAVILNKQLQPLPELVLSEEMVNNAAAFFRVKINYMCLMAHDITLGKDFKAFFKVVFCLWVLSIIGSFFFLLLHWHILEPYLQLLFLHCIASTKSVWTDMLESSIKSFRGSIEKWMIILSVEYQGLPRSTKMLDSTSLDVNLPAASLYLSNYTSTVIVLY